MSKKKMSWCLLMSVCDYDLCHWPAHTRNCGQNFVCKEKSKPAKPSKYQRGFQDETVHLVILHSMRAEV